MVLLFENIRNILVLMFQSIPLGFASWGLTQTKSCF